jgi:hypothetical protein
MKKHYLLFLAFTILTQAAIAQDDCASAPAIEPGFYIVDAVNGTDIPPVACSGAPEQASAAEWYTYTPDADYYMTISSNVPGVPTADTRMHIYTGTCGDLSCVGGDDDSGPGYSSIANMNVSAGVTYTIAWDNYWTSSGFTFSLSVGDPIVNAIDFISINAPVGSPLGAIDMNADYLDDIVEPAGQILNIAYQQPDGTFSTISHAVSGDIYTAPYWSLCGGDLDGNGFNDLVYAGGAASFIWADDAGSSYSETGDESYIFCQRSNLVDINNDGNLDAFVCHDVQPNVWYINNGTQLFDWNQGGLGDTPDGGNYGSVWIDYDNDCDIDMFIAKCRGGNSPANINQMHRNNGDGTFTEVGEEIGLADNVQTWSSAWADFDNDGDMDVVVGASSSANGMHKVMLNDGVGNFTDVTAGSGWDNNPNMSIEWVPADFNNDGFVDVLGGSGGIMLNNGNMVFSPSNVGFGVGPMGDFNNDGFIDVANGGTLNMGVPNGNNYITLNMRGVESNKNGIGARITLFTPSGQQIRDIRSGEGFRYLHSLNGHFGIGQDAQIDSLTVCWPSGITDKIIAPAINQNLVIIEGENFVNVDEQVTAESFEIYPNPATDAITLRGTTQSQVIISDISGKIVETTNAMQQRVDVRHLAPGVYFVQANTAQGIQQKKFIKQ